MAAPTYVATGEVADSTGALSVVWPTHQTDDVGLLFVEHANQAPAAPSGFALAVQTGVGTAGIAAATGVSVFWKRATSGSEAPVSVADTGARNKAFIMTFRGCIASGDPFDITGSSTSAGATAVSLPGGTTTVAETLVVQAVSNALAVGATTVQPNTVVNADLATLTKRKNTQLDGVGGGDPGLGFLPVGVFSQRTPGIGPGNTMADPRYKALFYGPAPNSIAADIDAADQHNVLLVLTLAGQKPQWNNPQGVYDPALYARQLDRFVFGAPGSTISQLHANAVTDAINRKRIVVYLNDEPNLNNHSTPAQQEEMGAMVKARWPNAITIIRCSPTLLRNGFSGGSMPQNRYPSIDYAWIQYTTAHTSQGISPAQSWATERAVITANNLNMGLCTSLNITSGGLTRTTNGVPACWDVQNNGSSNGVAVGDRQTAFAPGTYRTCAQAGTDGALLPSPKDVLASPAWIREFIDQVILDGQFPFAMFWNDPTATATTSDNWYETYYTRPDFESALDDAITAGLAATAATWRTPK